jgi:MYXO-CTERM domain-containing protein
MPWDLALLLAATAGDAGHLAWLAALLALLIAFAGRVRRRRLWLLVLPPILWVASSPEGAQ